jgi:hypothetical protein
LKFVLHAQEETMAPKTKSKKQIKRKSPVTKLSGKASAKLGKSVSKPSKKPVEPTRAMVLIHGAGSFPKSDVEAIAAKIKQLYGKPLQTQVAYYADWETRCSQVSVAVELPGADDFRTAFRAELQKRYDALPLSARPLVAEGVGDPNSVGGLAMLGILTNEVIAYLFKPSATQCIQQTLVQALQATKNFDEVVIVSHSLGTVVAFDVLKQKAGTYPIAHWITFGSPLAKLRVTGIRDDTLGQVTEQSVKTWYNVFDTTDIVADVISPSFPQPGYRIHDIFVEVASTMPDAHDYFNNAESLRLIVQALG